ncbi:UNVERIFIED_CONTAM: putative methyltransferase PMT2 [Sesamum radiatum]|uniref:Methyltransferase n=1 Tax=Sesamum radiatum TaxID=300843 RepID=A0AAW2JS02_SESRA
MWIICVVASWGAYLWKRNVIAMSFAPRDSHEAQVQFALERGVPAVIGVLGTIKLPYPSKAFDMAHCSRCLIPWGINDGLYMREVDRVLRPGGYWVLSGPPINWKVNYKAWKRPMEELQEEQRKIEEVAKLLCWEKKAEIGEIAIWQKSVDTDSCRAAQENSGAEFCKSEDADDVWYKKMEPCITRNDIANSDDVPGLKPFPERLYAVPPRIASGAVSGVSVEEYLEDNKLWKKHVNAYRKINRIIDSGRCEAFSTYPRTYDLIHANGVFSLYKDKCDLEDILLEMDRILRPEGAVIFRDEVDVLVKVKKMIGGMRWDSKMMDHEDGPLVPEKILVVVKQYWVGNSTSSQ